MRFCPECGETERLIDRFGDGKIDSCDNCGCEASQEFPGLDTILASSAPIYWHGSLDLTAFANLVRVRVLEELARENAVKATWRPRPIEGPATNPVAQKIFRERLKRWANGQPDLTDEDWQPDLTYEDLSEAECRFED